MRKLSHRMITGSIMLAAMAQPEAIIGAVVGSMLPDIDLKIGMAHRTWTHWWPMYVIPMASIWTMTHYGFIYTPSGKIMATIFFWMMVGALLHILEDSFTVTGVPLVNPVPSPFERHGVPWISAKQRFSLGLTHTGGILEYIIMLAVAGVAVIVVYHNPGYGNSLMSWPGTITKELGI